MLESILNSLKSEVGENIQGQTHLSSDKLDGAFSVIGEIAQKEVGGQMLSVGNILGKLF